MTTLNPRLPFDVDYTWTPGNYNFPFFLVRGYEYAPGTHTFNLNVVDSVLCADQASVTVEVLNATGIEQASASEWRFYPNPARDVVIIESAHFISGNVSIEITDVNGRIVFSEVIGASAGNKVEIDISALSRGSYMIRLIDQEMIMNQKLIKE
jgi:hypothetical protein